MAVWSSRSTILDWKPYETTSLRKKTNVTTVASLYTSRRPITEVQTLQEMKQVLHKDFHSFYGVFSLYHPGITT